MLKKYIDLVYMLEKIVPSNTEIVLHDMTDLGNSITAIANGHVSGRSIGMPVTDFSLKVLNSEKLQKETVIDGYYTVAKSGKKLNSYTYLIKNDVEQLIALLCFNVDTSVATDSLEAIAKLLQNQLSSNIHTQDKSSVSENFFENESDLIINAARDIINQYPIQVSEMKSEDKQTVVKTMTNRGVFLVKGSVVEVAKMLNVSQATLYRYISNKK